MRSASVIICRQLVALALLAFGALSPVAHAAGDTSQTASISVDSVSLNGEDFFAAYTHTDPAVREHAQIYLLGVMDASEGRSWCSYRVAKSVTLRELVFEFFRKQTPARLQQRASLLIDEALRTSLPCKVKK